MVRKTNQHTPNRILGLDVWQECIGELIAISEVDAHLVVQLDVGQLLFYVEFDDAERLRETLKGNEGRTIGILRTDLPDKEYFVNLEPFD